MHLVAKQVKGREYFYLVEKAWRSGTAVTVRTVYIGDRQKLAAALESGLVASLPEHFEHQEVGASLALVTAARSLGIEEIIDGVVPRREGALPAGRALVIAALHRVLAPRREKSKRHLRAYYEKSALRELLPVEPAALDVRRVCELLASLTPRDIEQIEARIVERMAASEGLGLQALAYDTTNFDSWACAGTKSRLLQRGHNKSGRPLRALGLGLLVTEEDGLPLLTFAYPGNENDTTAFRRFLRALDRRREALKLPVEATVVGDGGNVSRQGLLKLERSERWYVLRLPSRHAPQLARVPRGELHPAGASLKGKVLARKQTVKIYGVERTVVDVYSKRMRDKQLPGLRRDARRARRLLDELQDALVRQRAGKRRGKPLTLEAVRRKVDDALGREHMRTLFRVRVRRAANAPAVEVVENQEAWKHLDEHVLGRTLLVTNRDDWSTEQIILASRRQSHDESAFRDLKDPAYLSMAPLRHRRDAALRAHALVVVLALLLTRLTLRRARRAGADVRSVSALLSALAGVTRAHLIPRDDAAPAFKATLRSAWIPGRTDAAQDALLAALGLADAAELGTRPRTPLGRAQSGRRRKRAA
jgi:hypothetical protein